MGRITKPSADGGQHLAVIAILLLLAGICLIVPLLIGKILSEGREQAEYYNALQRTTETRSEIRQLFTSVQDAESAQRGFLLSGRQEFLNRYDEATARVRQRLIVLGTLATGTSLPPSVRTLEHVVPGVLDELRRGIADYQKSGSSASPEIAAGGGANEGMDKVRAAVDAALSAQSVNIQRLSADVQEQAANSQSVILVLFAGVILTILIAGAAGLVYFAHRRKAEKAFRDAWQTAEAAQQVAESANRAKTEFLTTMSHEIRTPLHSVIGSAELLLDGNNLSLQQREYVDRIQMSGTVLLNLVNDVLDLAKIEAGEVEILPEPFSLETLIDNSISIVQTTALNKGLRLRVALDHDLPLMLLGDESRLRQILLNLLGNAVKFTRFGEVVLRIEQRGSSESGETLRFSVSDTGPGIPANKRDRLFRRFSQISQSVHRSGGTGLGLAISKQLVELMGGDMGFESKEGQGSTFWFSLTLPKVEAELSSQFDLEESSQGLSGRILVVDDLDQNRELARRMLENAGYSVDLAVDGAQAIVVVQARPYDLVLMDIQMDGMDGITATKAIRQLNHAAKDVPIVAMTANVLAHDVKLFRTSGMNDHLGKPFKRKQLLDKVRQWLRAEPAAQTFEHRKEPTFALDQAAMDELCSAMGKEWVSKSLSDLAADLERTFKDVDPETADRGALAQQAHKLVARAGFLGFSELARLCSALEQACKRGEALGPILAKVKPAASQARGMADQLVRKLKVQA